MRSFFLLILILFVGVTYAQFTVRFIVTSVATKGNDDIYLSGNFNSWNPKDENYKLKPFGGNRKSIVLKNIPSGNLAFKFSRGSIDKFESTADGRDIADRMVEVNEDVSNEFTIAGWKDDYPDRPKNYTASPQVRMIAPEFTIAQLLRKRKVWIYLPKNYSSVGRAFPVLYMHDAQNLFNEKTAFAGEWGIDECLDTLQAKLGKECIVVGIENGGDKRITELNPYDHVQYGKGEGKAYLAFIVNQLKPYIDSVYRTKKGPDYTYIAGSSMGGLISMYALLKYPTVFGGAGIFSPSFWMAPSIFTDAAQFNSIGVPKCYFYAGSKEDPTLVPNMQKMATILHTKPQFVIRTVVNPLGQHNETYWRQEFPGFYTWLTKNW